MNEVFDYTMSSLFWSVVGFMAGVTATVLYLTSPRGRHSRFGRWLVGHNKKKVPEMDDRPKKRWRTRDDDFPYRPWRRFLGPIIIVLAIVSVASMAYDANQRNKQTRCLAGFIEATSVNFDDLRALTAQDRQVLDRLIRKVAAGQPKGAYRPLIARLRAGDSAESVLIDLLTAAGKDRSGANALKEYLRERRRIDAERAKHPLPQVSNCIDPKDLPHSAPMDGGPG
jgi:hypothetical protein